jgi:hypothetical protein
LVEVVVEPTHQRNKGPQTLQKGLSPNLSQAPRLESGSGLGLEN